MIEVFQPLTKASWRDRLKVTFWIVALASVILAPIQFVFELVSAMIAAVPFLFARSFSGAMQNKGFDDPEARKTRK